MSSSPFELFRRNLKPLMVLLTLLALISFVVLPAVVEYQASRANQGGSASRLASYDGGEFNANRVTAFTRTHYLTLQYLNQLAEVTIARGGTPKVSGFAYDAQNNRITSLGINSNPGEQESVMTMFYAAEAAKAGLELDDTAIRSWLTAYTDGRLTDAEINGVLASATNNQISGRHVYDQLRAQLLAEAFHHQALGGLAVGGLPLVPPAEQWALFQRLNRQAVADAFAVNVSEFLDKTDAKPSEREIQRVFEEGKERFPDPTSAQHAFRRPYQAEIEYLTASLDDFVSREAAQFSEEELRAEYQRRLDGGEFQLPIDLLPPETDPSGDEPAADAEPAAEIEPAATDAPAEMADEPAADAPTEPAADAPAEPAADAPAEPTADAPAEPAADTPADETPASDEPAAEPASDEPVSRATSVDNGLRLVAARAQDEPAVEATADDSAATDDAAEPAAATDPVAATEPAADTDAAAPPAEAEAAMVESTEVPTRQRSFEEVRDDLARSLALPKAHAALSAALDEVNATMRTYFNARAINSNNPDKIPARPDLKALGEKLGMQFVRTGLVNAAELRAFPIIQSINPNSMSMGMGTRGEDYLQMMYINRPQLFTGQRSFDIQNGRFFISWKVSEKDASIPTLAEARDEVILAIRMDAARKLAAAEAEKLAAQFNGSDKPVRELVGDAKAALLFESLGPFSWMNSLGFGMQAYMGNVEELDNIGEQFMRQVFATEAGTWTVAPNAPENVFYVVRPVDFTPEMEELQTQFAEILQRFQANQLAVQEVIRVRDGFYESLRKKTGFRWNEAALSERE